MTFAKKVFVGAGVWGMFYVTPLYFLFDAIGRQNSLPITYPQFYYGFLAVTLAWQLAFIVIGSDPVRFRPLMIAAILEKGGFITTIVLLYLQRRVGGVDLLVVSPDCLLGILFVIAFVKTSAAAAVQEDISLHEFGDARAESRRF
jgi:hypothetical protein